MRKVDPIRLNVKRKWEPKPSSCKRKTQPEVRVDAQVVTVADVSQRRLQLAEALEYAGKLFDELTTDRFLSAEAKQQQQQQQQQDGDYEIFRNLVVRKIMIDSLANELKTRSVLPVTINTLSNLFSFVYLRVIH
jgi:hypothetical protein